MADELDSPRDQLLLLLELHERRICSYLRALLNGDSAVEDCAQDTFLSAYELLRQGRPVNVTWLYKVARSRAIDTLRERQRLRSDTELVRGELSAPELDEMPQVIAVRDALSKLSPSDRELLYLFLVDKLSTAEIAEMTGARPGAIRVRLFRARIRLRSLIERSRV